jgi:hypothetical protein
MPDESREALCSIVAGTLSDQQLAKCGLSGAANMSTSGSSDNGSGDLGDEDQSPGGAGNPDAPGHEKDTQGMKGNASSKNAAGASWGGGTISDDPANSGQHADAAALQAAMDKAKPEVTPGGMNMSQAGAATGSKSKPHPHSLELAELKAEHWLGRARAVHAKNPNAITANMLEGYEAAFQGAKSLSLLKPDFGDLAAIPLQITTAERMVNGEDNSTLTENRTGGARNMSLAGAGASKAQAVPMPKANANGFNEEEAKKVAEDRWK